MSEGSKFHTDSDEILRLVTPLITYLRDNYNPYCSIVIKNDSVSLVENISSLLSVTL